MNYTREELILSIQNLRARREAIPELRDYKPPTKAGAKGTASKASKTPKKAVEVITVFAGLFKKEVVGGETSPGELNGTDLDETLSATSSSDEERAIGQEDNSTGPVGGSDESVPK